jgi:uncharacterized protein (TIGR00661 family)
MRILYAVQATGNGHISRAIELLPFIEQYGKVDIFLSGNNCNLDAELPVKFRSKGVSLFYGNKGGLDYWKMVKDFSLRRIWKEANGLPVDQYDIVLNDFDSITSLACAIKKVPSVGFGHQASFQSKATPRAAKKDFAGDWVLNHYAPASNYIGLHFKQYDDFIFSPILKHTVINAEPTNQGYVTVYLSHYNDMVVKNALAPIKDIQFQVFSKKVKQPITEGNITFLPISNDAFTQSMIHCAGVITGAGFETPAEALYLGKKLLCLPIKGQYEQLCNAVALEEFGVPIIDTINDQFAWTVKCWLNGLTPKPLQLTHSTYDIVQYAMELARSKKHTNASFSELLSNEDLLVLD